MSWKDYAEKELGYEQFRINPGESKRLIITPGTPDNPPWREINTKFGKAYIVKVGEVSPEGKFLGYHDWLVSRTVLQMILDLEETLGTVIPPDDNVAAHVLLVSRKGSGLQTRWTIFPDGQFGVWKTLDEILKEDDTMEEE